MFQSTSHFSSAAKDLLIKDLVEMQSQIEQAVIQLKDKGKDFQNGEKLNWELKVSQLEERTLSIKTLLEEVGRSNEDNWQVVQKSAKQTWDEIAQTMNDSLDQR